MKYIPLLNKQLKSEAIKELLEKNNMVVVYEFDRIHENTPDKYWSKCFDRGIELAFDETQSLRTIFLYLSDREGFSPVNLSGSDLFTFQSKKEAIVFAKKEMIPFHEGKNSFLGINRDWIRFDYNDYSIHYEYQNNSLALLTIISSPML